MSRSWLLLCPALAALGLAFTGCREQPSEGPLPEQNLALASAAPGATGALAAGTDAAPPPPARRATRTWQVPGDEEEEPIEPEGAPDGGFDLDGGLEPAPVTPEMPL